MVGSITRYRINEYLELRLEQNTTQIYINNRQFITCKYLLTTISLNKINHYDNIESMDEFIDKRNESGHITYNSGLTSKEAFWGHCSNFQAWYEHNYNTNLLDSKLAFPILKELVKLGDIKAKRVFREEIIRKLKLGYWNTLLFLIKDKYLSNFSIEELEIIRDDLSSNSKYPISYTSPKLLLVDYINRKKMTEARERRKEEIKKKEDKLVQFTLDFWLHKSFKHGDLFKIAKIKRS